MITFDDLTPQELRDLAQFMMEKKDADLARTREITGLHWSEGAQDRYNRQVAIATLLNAEAERRQLMQEARGWIADCQWGETFYDPEFPEDLTDEQVFAGIERHYDGGWDQFQRDVRPWEPTTAGLLRGDKVVWSLRSGEIPEQPPARTVWDRDARP